MITMTPSHPNTGDPQTNTPCNYGTVGVLATPSGWSGSSLTKGMPESRSGIGMATVSHSASSRWAAR